MHRLKIFLLVPFLSVSCMYGGSGRTRNKLNAIFNFQLFSFFIPLCVFTIGTNQCRAHHVIRHRFYFFIFVGSATFPLLSLFLLFSSFHFLYLTICWLMFVSFRTWSFLLCYQLANRMTSHSLFLSSCNLE